MAAGAVDRLLSAGSGDAALLYLWLLKTGGEYDAAGAARTLKWDPVRADGAMQLLAGMKLADPKRSKAPPAPPRQSLRNTRPPISTGSWKIPPPPSRPWSPKCSGGWEKCSPPLI